IPVIWQGTEQGFERQRRAMFAGGYDSGGRDHFDVEAPLYRYLQRAIALRRDHRLFSRGTPTVLASNAAAAGAIAWRMDHAGEAALVVLNTADAAVLLDNLAPGVAAGTRLDGLFAIDGTPAEAVADASGRLTLVLPPRSGQVWRLPVGTRVAAEGGPPTAPTTGLDVEPLPDAVQRGDFTVRGRAPGRRQVRVVVDGDLASAQDVAVGADGRWSARVRTGGMIEPEAMHRVVAFDPAGGQASGAREFHVEHD